MAIFDQLSSDFGLLTGQQGPSLQNQLQASQLANFDYNPGAITNTGTYKTEDWLSILGGLATGGLTGAASGAGVNDAVARLQALGQTGVTDYTNLARAATQNVSFTPYALTSALGTTQQTTPGVISQQLTPQQQANINAAQAMQGGLYGAAIPNVSGIQQQAFGGIGGYLSPTGNQQIQNLSGMFGGIAGTAGAQYGAPTGLEGTTAQALRGAASGLGAIGAGFGGIDAYSQRALAQGTAGLGQIGGGMGGMQVAADQAIRQGTAGLGQVGTGLGDINALRSQYAQAAQQASGMLGGSTQNMANQLFQTQQAMVTPEQQRQQLALEDRLRAQGRLGVTTAQYGGTPEQLAMAKAVQEQLAGSAYGAMTNAEQMAASQQARALGLGQATTGMAQAASGLMNEQQNRALGMLSAGVNINQAISGLTSEQQQRAMSLAQSGMSGQQIASQLVNDQQNRALGLLTAGQQGTSLQNQLQASQLAQAQSAGQQTATLAAANQALKQGDIQTASSLFNIGSAAAQLPQQMQGQNIAMAGQLQTQALAPAAQQLQQAQLAGTLGQQRASTAYQAGGLFGNLAGAGLQERLTAESAAAALRGKQYSSALSSLANQGGQNGTAAGVVQNMINQGIKKIGDNLVDATGKVIGKAADLLGDTASSLWDSIGNVFDTDVQFEEDWQKALAGKLTSDDSNIIEEGWNNVTNWFKNWWED